MILWRPVVGFEDTYEISRIGIVRRVKPGRGARVGRVLRPRVLRKGIFVSLTKNGKSLPVLLQKLLRETWSKPELFGRCGYCGGDDSVRRVDSMDYPACAKCRNVNLFED